MRTKGGTFVGLFLLLTTVVAVAFAPPAGALTASTTTTVSSAPSPSQVGQSVTFTATITTGSPIGDPGQGTVDFTEDGNLLADDVPLTGNQASFSTSALAHGSHVIVATYSGFTDSDSGNQWQGSSGQVTHNVKTTPSIGLFASPSSSTYREYVEFTAFVPDNSCTASEARISACNAQAFSSPGAPTGTVEFFVDGTDKGAAPLGGGQARFSTESLSAGTHEITATYNGDAVYNGNTDTLSYTVAKNTPTVGTTSAPNPSKFGQTVTITSSVTPAEIAEQSGTSTLIDDTEPLPPTGSVEFFDGATSLGTAPLSGTTAALTTSSLAVGTHTLTGRYLGDTNYNIAEGATSHTVSAFTPTTTTVSTPRNPSTLFRPLTLTGTVAGLGGAAVGTVTFFDGATALGTSPVNASGVATLPADRLSLGDHILTAVFSGAGEFGPSTSAPITQTVGLGYLLTTSDGQVVPFGTGRDFSLNGILGLGRGQVAALGLAPNSKLNAPITGLATTPTGNGFYLLGGDGGIFTFGDATFYGSTGNRKLNKPVVGMATTPTNLGYWLVASDGGIFTFGDAGFFGSNGDKKLNSPIIAMTPTPTGLGYWLVATDGGVFSFGDAGYFGSFGDKKLNSPIIGIAATPSGLGYTLVAADGGTFSFGDAGFFGSMGGQKLVAPVIGMVATPTGLGYWLLAADGGVFAFGDAPFLGSGSGLPLGGKAVVGFGYA